MKFWQIVALALIITGFSMPVQSVKAEGYQQVPEWNLPITTVQYYRPYRRPPPHYRPYPPRPPRYRPPIYVPAPPVYYPPAPPRYRPAPPPRYCNYNACSYRYKSFRASDCTYQPYNGPRTYCRL
ncbi:BA14K family protein [uncultured Cohaesibacter sp.]|uniref:BA14K family protein n=1 Tax=uncultured Cohaesibacter sp. TaxID=1002546 RepID=UPI0029C76C0B|nr:BA14K family protein [uncultured Cohaesibacter sp.]